MENKVVENNLLKVLDIGIDTHQEPVVYMRSDCHICRSEGFSANSRVLLVNKQKSVIATLNVVDDEVLPHDAIGLSKIALERLQVKTEDFVLVDHAPVVTSLTAVRKKIFGHKLDEQEISQIIMDISAYIYSDIEIASFLSACAGSRLDIDEIISLTQAMVSCGKQLNWPDQHMILDKHCIGGVPGNKTTPLIVSIISASGLIIPKTSSRAITSPAGTADTMEVLTKVNLSLDEIRQTVSKTGACLAWGGAVNLSPADDILIRVERALDLDGEGQLIASVLSKKIAAGSTHAIIDIPVGETAKVRTMKEANRLASLFTQVGAACGINIRCLITDGSQPVGMGIGPVEEAKDILSVLQNKQGAPADLRERALYLSAELLSLAKNETVEKSRITAESILDNGLAWKQFQRIINAQGQIKELPTARYQHTERVPESGKITGIDNRQLARLAKLAGAPSSPTAGLRLHARVGDSLSAGSPLFSLMTETTGEQEYALTYYRQQGSPFKFTAMET